jgi:hypothetical protein
MRFWEMQLEPSGQDYFVGVPVTEKSLFSWSMLSFPGKAP